MNAKGSQWTMWLGLVATAFLLAAGDASAANSICESDAVEQAKLAIDAACPCAGRADATGSVQPWADHLEYRMCTIRAAREQRRTAAGVRSSCLSKFVNFAAHSLCGVPADSDDDAAASSPETAGTKTFARACNTAYGPYPSAGRNTNKFSQEACAQADATYIYGHALFALDGTAGVYSHSSSRRFSTNVTITDANTGQWWGTTCTHTGWQETWDSQIHWRFCDLKIRAVRGHRYFTRAQTAFDVRDDGHGQYTSPTNGYIASPTRQQN